MNVNRQMAKGAAWTVGLRMFHRIIGFVSMIILARLLMPEDFGLIAMATVFLQLLVAASDFSVHVPLIQKAQIDRKEILRDLWQELAGKHSQTSASTP